MFENLGEARPLCPPLPTPICTRDDYQKCAKLLLQFSNIFFFY